MTLIDRHTPGPWIAEIDGITRPVITDTDGDAIAFISVDNYAPALSNAHLIAAAPDMLAALKVAQRIMNNVFGGEQSDTYDQISAAIAKAEGRS